MPQGMSRLSSGIRAFAIALVALPLAPLGAKESLGVFGDWGAFADPQPPRCYAIAAADDPPRSSRAAARDYVPFASVGTWPQRDVRGQLHFRLSRRVAEGAAIGLRIGDRSFVLTGGGGDAWARDPQMDAAIVAAMRSGETMRVSARDTAGRRFTDSYSLAGAATAMDAATVGCAGNR